jgi:hypothetical protein
LFLNSIVLRGSSIINQIAENRAETVGYCRFLSNEKVQPTMIIDLITKEPDKFVVDRHVLVVNDTTEFNYQDHINFLNPDDNDLGPNSNSIDIGFFLHAGLVVDFSIGFWYIHK